MQHPVGTGPVDGAVRQRQVMDVAEPDVYGGKVGGTLPRGVDHPLVAVDADHRSGRGDPLGERFEVGARTAADVQHRLPGADVEFLEHAPLVGAAQIGPGEPVEVGDVVRLGGFECR